MMIKQRLVVVLLFAVSLIFTNCGGGGSSGGNSGGQTYAIGDTGPSGVGIVFYVTDGGLHGFEAAPADYTTLGETAKFAWKTDTTTSSRETETGTAIGEGYSNTWDHLYTNTYPAADNCLMYRFFDEGDWFLPSLDELALLYEQRDVVGGFFTGVSDAYWSSSISSPTSNAWAINFGDGNAYAGPKTTLARVRPVREF